MKRTTIIPAIIAFIALAGNAGAQPAWEQLSAGSAGYKGAYFLDSKHGYLVGDEAILAVTTDGGDNWSQITLPTQKGLWGVYASPGSAGDVIVVAGDDGTVLKSTDGGGNWTAQDAKYSHGFTFGLFGASPDRLWVTGGEGDAGSTTGVIVRTTDGGANWSKVTVDGSYSFDKAYFADANVGYAAATSVGDFSSGGIYKTTDGGATWQLSKATETGAINSVYCFDAEHCIAGGFNNVALRTTDGGASWSPVTLPPGGFDIFTHVLFVDAMRGYMADALGAILVSTDGGATWTRDESFSGDQPIWSLALAKGTSETSVFAVGDAGSVFRITIPTSGASVNRAREVGSLDAVVRMNRSGGDGSVAVALPRGADLDVALYDARGARVATLFHDRAPAGMEEIALHGAALPSGAYFCIARADGHAVARPVMITR